MESTETVSVTGANVNITAPEAGGQSPGSVLVTSLARHKYGGVRYEKGEKYYLPQTLVNPGVLKGLIADPNVLTTSWHDLPGRELRVEQLIDTSWSRVVACLNVWNDRPALQQTIHSWLPYVDHVIAVDGAYQSTGIDIGPSTDGTIEYLREVCGDKLTLIEAPKGRPWKDQQTKRSQYLLDDGSLLFVIDADEFVENGELLRFVRTCDVGWVKMSSPVYKRPYDQPRLFRAMPGLNYQGRHHWLYVDDKLLATHQYGGTGFEHSLVGLSIRNERGLGHTPERAEAKRTHQKAQHSAESRKVAGKTTKKSDGTMGAREALRIIQLAGYDPGLVGYRLHTALNVTTPHASIFARLERKNVFKGPSQFDPEYDQDTLRPAVKDSDVIHCHVDYTILDSLNVDRMGKSVVIHHHGSRYRGNPSHYNQRDAGDATLRLVSNLELLQYGENLHFLPNPVPIGRYRRLASQSQRIPGVFRIAHSPSKRAAKGTEFFLAVCEKLIDKGLPIEPVIIEGLPHSEALALKATCDIAFDSFWLGMQCSGIEAAAMGMPVIAGDPDCKAAYVRDFGGVPYTYAEDAVALEEEIERLVLDAEYFTQERDRVSGFVESYHDESAVALRYLDLLDGVTNWRQAMRTDRNDIPKTHDAPTIERQRPCEPKKPKQRKPRQQRPKELERRTS